MDGIKSLKRGRTNMTSGNMSSTIAKNQKTITKMLDKINKSFREMNGGE